MSNDDSDNLALIADMLAEDLGRRYQTGDVIEGKLVIGEAKETLSALKFDTSLSFKVISLMCERGYVTRKGVLFTYQSMPARAGNSVGH